jgi:hypothetical protein
MSVVAGNCVTYSIVRPQRGMPVRDCLCLCVCREPGVLIGMLGTIWEQGAEQLQAGVMIRGSGIISCGPLIVLKLCNKVRECHVRTTCSVYISTLPCSSQSLLVCSALDDWLRNVVDVVIGGLRKNWDRDHMVPVLPTCSQSCAELLSGAQ